MSNEHSCAYKEHKELIQLVYAYDYYISVFERAQEMYPPDLSTADGIRTFWNDFWHMLPDTPGIQRAPFARICGMAVNSYN